MRDVRHIVRRRLQRGIAILAVLPLWPGAALAQFEAAAPEPVGKIAGSLLIHGGGTIATEVIDRFVELAGGKNAKIVVVPTASYRADEPDTAERISNMWKARDLASVAVLHTRDKSQANDPAFAEPLKSATGVWISGGKQQRVEEAYSGTLVEKALLEILRRGGAIGGSSAGAAVMSKVMIAGGKETPQMGTGFDFLPGAIVDQHFSARERLGRLLQAVNSNPGLVGLGIDQGTSLIVRGRTMSVMGEGAVSICMAAVGSQPERVTKLLPGKTADLIAINRAVLARNMPAFPPSSPPPPDVPAGSLVIVGGGGTPKGLLEKFIELAGGPEAPLVCVPCTEADTIDREPGMCEAFRKAGAKYVSWIHTKDRTKANADEAILSPLKTARGIWFGGGRQWNLVDSYQNTTAHRLMHDVLARGGVIGGSSAGASIQGDYMPRGDPLGNLNIIAEGYERGLGFLTGVAIDQHFTQRKRQPDMSLLMKTYPQSLGIGIDESTAIIVRRSVAEVVGANRVAFYDARRTPAEGEQEYHSLQAGQKFDLKNRQILAEADTVAGN